ncbi:4-hydroxy-tetrahydrodipicolinate reductase [Austwickia chelonae]|uniref:Putative dihydrodipicolinate reductase n=1 Tax=Austwickia chelonae NBRC 105200 TaxID=1184607 RepID=K6VL39_9MICO|nr:2,4-diaminopentanoate dehydrogenase [Austwickia chelonae]GAB77449.1 putative dihydrodipicolinate reductase [Austwickia chelonae NBRC 105200]SEW10672.1 4-hydroxy-tetrahydrodipicolinate reductase [Austwickia chelonae]
MSTIRVVQWGLGAMGSGMARLVLDKEGLELVGGIDTRPEYVGRDLGDVLDIGRSLGVTVTDDPGSILRRDEVDCVVIATTSWVSEQMADLRTVLNAGINCVSIAEEMASPEAQNPELAAELDELAKANGVTLLGTGVNPGLSMDLLVVALTAGCHQVTSVEARRVNDLSPYGPTVMRTQGVGLTPEEFAAGVEDGSVDGHIGFPESARMISDALGLDIDRIEQRREAIVSTVRRETPHVVVEPGMVAGCKQTLLGYRGDEVVLTLVHPQQVLPELEGQGTGDYITIKGVPEINMQITPEYAGGTATKGIAVNSIPRVVEATPGLKNMLDLPVPAALMGAAAYRRRV